MPNSILRDAVALNRDASSGRLVADLQVSVEDSSSHVDTLLLVRVGVEGVPPVAAEHDGDFGTGGCVLAFYGVGVEDDAECTLWVLGEGNGAWDEVAEASFWEDVRIFEVEVDDHYCHRVSFSERWEGVGCEGREDPAGDCGDSFGVLGRSVTFCQNLSSKSVRRTPELVVYITLTLSLSPSYSTAVTPVSFLNSTLGFSLKAFSSAPDKAPIPSLKE